MSRFILASCLVLVFAVSAQANHNCGLLGQECLVNGNLDAGTAGGGGAPGSADGWSLVNVGSATASQFQGGFADNTGVRGLWFRAFLGSTASPVDSTLSQVTDPIPTSGSYLLTFDAVVEQNFTAGSLIATVAGGSGGPVSRDLLLDRVDAGSDYTGGGFNQIGNASPPHNTQLSLLVQGVSASDVLTVSVAMVGGTDGGTNPQSVVMDNFSLTRVPEPTSILLLGMGTLGLMIRRRR